MTPNEHQFYRVTEITNNLRNFKPLGVLFLHDLPSLPAKGIKASHINDSNADTDDSWCWLEVPFDENTVIKVSSEGNKYTLSQILNDLRYLINRAHIRVTYKIFHSNLAVLRVYVLPIDINDGQLLDDYRKLYFRRSKPMAWHEKTYKTIVQNLINVLDYSEQAWNLRTDANILEHFIKEHTILFRCIEEYKLFSINELGRGYKSLQAGESESCMFNFHLDRMVSGKPFMKFTPRVKETQNERNTEDDTQNRLAEIYNNINSPRFDFSVMDQDQRETVNEVLNDEVVGFKSGLYNYQRRSVAKMFEKELFSNSVLVPNLIAIDKTKDNKSLYFDIQTLSFLNHPRYYNTPKGGILAENMGLGKTCICLALICISKFQISEVPPSLTTKFKDREVQSLVDNCVRFINRSSIQWKQYANELPSSCTKKLEANLGYFESSESKQKRVNTRASVATKDMILKKIYVSSTTLVVIPDNLFHQWRLEIKKHVEEGYLNILEIQEIKSKIPDSVSDILEYDIILISLNTFAKQAEIPDSILRNIYWKRLIVDEGHSMNSKITRAVTLAKELHVERKWTITGTPTSGLTNLHVEQEDADYTIKKKFNPKDDLLRLGIVISNFLKVEPWSSNSKLWTTSVIKPFEEKSFNSDYQITEILKNLIVRHSVKDVESDIKLPKLHHKPVFLRPSFFDKLSINLFIAVLATNAVTSERVDKDYMFHPSNKIELRRLINNLQKATFYWTGFSIQDIENLLNICKYSMKTNKGRYSSGDITLLENSIYTSKLALSNSRWRTACTIHEMSYFVSNLPQSIHQSLSVSNYETKLDDYRNPVGVYGYPQLNAIQKLYYKNRLICSIDDLINKLDGYAKRFWNLYWSSNSSQNGIIAKGNKSKVINGNNDSRNRKDRGIDVESLKYINEKPIWINQFDPKIEEKKSFILHNNNFTSTMNKKRKNVNTSINNNQSPAKKIKYIPRGRQTPVTPDPIVPPGNISSHMRNANILGTASSKLSYLASRLLENQILGVKSIVFYEFENSAYYLTELLDLIGLNYLMYSTYIKVSDRSNNLSKFDMWDVELNNGIVLIMDLKLASHGLTIISATDVFFINPIWNKTMEAQAIKRSHRIGQTKEVFVETLILENTIEEEMYNKRKDDNNDDLMKEDNSELIDNSGMQEYIMRFEFLKMFDNFQDEYEPVRSVTTVSDSLKLNKYSGDSIDDFDDDGIRLFCCKSNVIENSVRNWQIPLFSEESMLKINENESKLKDKNKSNVQNKRMKVDGDEINGQNKDNGEVKNATVELISKLKKKRTVRFG